MLQYFYAWASKLNSAFQMASSPRRFTTTQQLLRVLFLVVFLPVIYYAYQCGLNIYSYSKERAQLKHDYSEANSIVNGLLSVDRWRDNISEIVMTQINEFTLTQQQEDTLQAEVNKILNNMISQADSMINQKQTSVGGKLKKFAFNTFVNVDKIRAQVPAFSQSIINEVKRPRTKERLKFVAREKLQELAAKTRDSVEVQVSDFDKILIRYQAQTLGELNKEIAIRSEALQDNTYDKAFTLIGLLIGFVILWRFLRYWPMMYTPMFVASVLLALVVLITSLFTPMIEIDARIQKMSFLLIGKHVEFTDQVLFYQSKSIMDVIRILINTHKADSVLVGVLILAFSVLFPIAKLLSTEIFLMGRARWTRSGIVRFFAFKSGKWSMADVMVVAIFMAYIGFKGIIDSQLENINLETKTVKSIATNHTSLQPGFILFTSFVMFSLLLSVILKRIAPPAPAAAAAVAAAEPLVPETDPASPVAL